MLEVFIEDLAAKNEGYSVGRWITLPMDEDLLREEIDEMLKEGQILSKYVNIHEECEIIDYEWDEEICEIFSLDNNDNIYAVNADISLIEEKVQTCEYKIIKFLLGDRYAYDVENAIEKIIEVSLYEDCSLEDVAMYRFDDYFGLEKDEHITKYLNFKEWGEDLQLDGYIKIGKDILYYPY